MNHIISSTPICTKSRGERTEPKWQRVNSSKRSRSSPQGARQSSNIKQKKLDTYWLSTEPKKNSNRYSVLDEDSYLSEDPNEKNEKIVIFKPPPIFFAGVGNIQTLRQLLNEIAPNEYDLKILASNEVKIQPSSSEKYTVITKALEAKKKEFSNKLCVNVSLCNLLQHPRILLVALIEVILCVVFRRNEV